MAGLTTEDKRRSATGVFCMFIVDPVADATINSKDRMQATELYGGVAPGGFVPTPSVGLNKGVLLHVYGR